MLPCVFPHLAPLEAQHLDQSRLQHAHQEGHHEDAAQFRLCGRQVVSLSHRGQSDWEVNDCAALWIDHVDVDILAKP